MESSENDFINELFIAAIGTVFLIVILAAHYIDVERTSVQWIKSCNLSATEKVFGISDSKKEECKNKYFSDKKSHSKYAHCEQFGYSDCVAEVEIAEMRSLVYFKERQERSYSPLEEGYSRY